MNNETVELSFFSDAIIRRWYLPLGLAVIGALIGLQLRPAVGATMYEAESRLLIRPVTDSVFDSNLRVDQIINADTEAQLAGSELVARDALELLGDEAPPALSVDTLVENLDVTVRPDSQIVVVKYQNEDPDVAGAVADAVADAYLSSRTSTALEERDRQATQLTAQISELTRDLTSANITIATAEAEADARRSLLSRIGTLEEVVAVGELRGQESAPVGDPIGALRAELAALENTVDPVDLAAATTSAELLTGQIANLRDELIKLSTIEIDGGDVIQQAGVGDAVLPPNGLVYPAIGALAGLMLGVAGAVLVERSVVARSASTGSLSPASGGPGQSIRSDNEPRRPAFGEQEPSPVPFVAAAPPPLEHRIPAMAGSAPAPVPAAGRPDITGAATARALEPDPTPASVPEPFARLHSVAPVDIPSSAESTEPAPQPYDRASERESDGTDARRPAAQRAATQSAPGSAPLPTASTSLNAAAPPRSSPPRPEPLETAAAASPRQTGPPQTAHPQAAPPQSASAQTAHPQTAPPQSGSQQAVEERAVASGPQVQDHAVQNSVASLADVPKIPRSAREPIVVSAPATEPAIALRRVARLIQNTTNSINTPVILVSSPKPHEGRTTVAANVASALRQDGQSVLLITDSYARVIAPGVHVLPPGMQLGPDLEYPATERLRELMTEAKDLVDIVIIDGPPLLGSEEALRVASVANASVIVAVAGRTSAHDVATTKLLLESTGTDVLGLVTTARPSWLVRRLTDRTIAPEEPQGPTPS